MEERSNGLTILLVIAVVWLMIAGHGHKKTIERLHETIDECSSSIDDANSIIEDLNSGIEDATWAAWSDYDSMGYALENLSTGDTVANDCYVLNE